jgi:hypothetical protein
MSQCLRWTGPRRRDRRPRTAAHTTSSVRHGSAAPPTILLELARAAHAMVRVKGCGFAPAFGTDRAHRLAIHAHSATPSAATMARVRRGSRHDLCASSTFLPRPAHLVSSRAICIKADPRVSHAIIRRSFSTHSLPAELRPCPRARRAAPKRPSCTGTPPLLPRLSRSRSPITPSCQYARLRALSPCIRDATRRVKKSALEQHSDVPLPHPCLPWNPHPARPLPSSRSCATPRCLHLLGPQTQRAPSRH